MFGHNIQCYTVRYTMLIVTYVHFNRNLLQHRYYSYVRTTRQLRRMLHMSYRTLLGWPMQQVGIEFSSTCFGHPRAHHQELQKLQ
jgi:hypothetical protein